MITGKLYDQLKFLAQIILPALGTLYFALAGIWGLPAAEQVVGTIVAGDTFLGVLLGISQVNYAKSDVAYEGALEVSQPTAPGEPKLFSLTMHGDPEELLENKKAVRFRVDHERAPKQRRHK